MNFVQTTEFDWLPWQPNVKFAKKYSKIISLEAMHKGGGVKLKLYINVHNIRLYENCVFITVARVLWLLWQLKVSIDL